MRWDIVFAVMNKHIQNLLDGVRRVFVILPDCDYVIPARGDFRKDRDNLRSDASRIASGLRSSVKNKPRLRKKP